MFSQRALSAARTTPSGWALWRQVHSNIDAEIHLPAIDQREKSARASIRLNRHLKRRCFTDDLGQARPQQI
jgi:hypothetical protein